MLITLSFPLLPFYISREFECHASGVEISILTQNTIVDNGVQLTMKTCGDASLLTGS